MKRRITIAMLLTASTAYASSDGEISLAGYPCVLLFVALWIVLFKIMSRTDKDWLFSLLIWVLILSGIPFFTLVAVAAIYPFTNPSLWAFAELAAIICLLCWFFSRFERRGGDSPPRGGGSDNGSDGRAEPRDSGGRYEY